MTIDSAAIQWNVKPKTVLEYIRKEYIAGITCENARLSLPEIPKPYIPPQKRDGSYDRDRAILTACSKSFFIDEHILRCSRASFEAHMTRLVEGGYLSIIDDTLTKGNLGYQCTAAGSNVVSSKESLNLPDININISVVGGVGLIG